MLRKLSGPHQLFRVAGTFYGGADNHSVIPVILRGRPLETSITCLQFDPEVNDIEPIGKTKHNTQTEVT